MTPLSARLTKAMELTEDAKQSTCSQDCLNHGHVQEHARLQPFLEVLIEAAKVLDEQHELLHNVRAMISDTDLAHKDIGLHMKTTRELMAKLQTLLDAKEG